MFQSRSYFLHYPTLNCMKNEKLGIPINIFKYSTNYITQGSRATEPRMFPVSKKKKRLKGIIVFFLQQLQSWRRSIREDKEELSALHLQKRWCKESNFLKIDIPNQRRKGSFQVNFVQSTLMRNSRVKSSSEWHKCEQVEGVQLDL